MLILPLLLITKIQSRMVQSAIHTERLQLAHITNSSVLPLAVAKIRRDTGKSSISVQNPGTVQTFCSLSANGKLEIKLVEENCGGTITYDLKNIAHNCCSQTGITFRSAPVFLF